MFCKKALQLGHGSKKLEEKAKAFHGSRCACFWLHTWRLQRAPYWEPNPQPTGMAFWLAYQLGWVALGWRRGSIISSYLKRLSLKKVFSDKPFVEPFYFICRFETFMEPFYFICRFKTVFWPRPEPYFVKIESSFLDPKNFYWHNGALSHRPVFWWHL